MMKYTFILLLLFALNPVFSQDFSIGLKITPNVLTIKSPPADTQNILFENVFYNGGLVGEYAFNPRWSVSLGAMLNTYGIQQRVYAVNEVPPTSSFIPSYIMNAYSHYINVPIALRYQARSIYLEGGFHNKYLLKRTLYKPNNVLYSDEKPSDLLFLSEGFVGFGTMVNYGNWQLRAGMNAVIPIVSPFFSIGVEVGMFYRFGNDG